jgi:hypothetical protein
VIGGFLGEFSGQALGGAALGSGEGHGVDSFLIQIWFRK